MPYYFNVVLDNGVKPREVSEFIVTPALAPRGRSLVTVSASSPPGCCRRGKAVDYWLAGDAAAR
jgi:hypothetical protein